MPEYYTTVHNIVKDYQCEQCEYSMDNDSIHKCHIKKVYSNVKDYQYEQCEYSMDNDINLICHIKKSTYQCQGLSMGTKWVIFGQWNQS